VAASGGSQGFFLWIALCCRWAGSIGPAWGSLRPTALKERPPKNSSINGSRTLSRALRYESGT
ncbi:MAG: hypothetical protein WAO17_04390, partial [Candidatus Sulfotelmatobacter sp.]